MLDVSLLDRERARLGINAQSCGPTTNLVAIAIALGSALARLLGAVLERIPAEALTTVLETSDLFTERITHLDAVGSGDAVVRHGVRVVFKLVTERAVGVDEIGVAAYGFPVTRAAFDG